MSEQLVAIFLVAIFANAWMGPDAAKALRVEVQDESVQVLAQQQQLDAKCWCVVGLDFVASSSQHQLVHFNKNIFLQVNFCSKDSKSTTQST